MDDIEHVQVGLVACSDSDEIETLRKQIAELTERLRLSEALRTSDMETIAKQAAQIKTLRGVLIEASGNPYFYELWACSIRN